MVATVDAAVAAVLHPRASGAPRRVDERPVRPGRGTIRVSAEPTMTSVAMSAGRAGAASRVTTSSRASVAADRPAEDHRGCRRQVAGEQVEGRRELRRAGSGHGIVERDDEACLRGEGEAALDECPGLEVVRQRDGAEVVAERRAGGGGDGEHRGHAGDDGEVDGAPCRLAVLDRLADRRRHGEDAGVAARDHRHPRTGRGKVERGAGARQLLAVVGGVAGLSGAVRHALEIGPVAVDGLGRRECRCRLGGEEARVAGAEADDGEAAGHGRWRPRRHEDHGEVGRVPLGGRGERHDPRLGHRAALDIDGAVEPAGDGDGLADLGEMPADLDDGDRIAAGEPRGQRLERDGSRHHRQHLVGAGERQAGRRPAAREAGDAGDDLGRVAVGEADVDVHVRPVEQRVALGEHRHGAPGVEVGGDGGRRRHRRSRRWRRRRRDRWSGSRWSRDSGAAVRRCPAAGGSRRWCARCLSVPALAKWATTSASRSARTALRVISSGSPGPTPTPISRAPLMAARTVRGR
jgi:hypothetical protein